MRRELIASFVAVAFGLLCLYPVLGAQFVLVDDHEIISYTQPGAGPPLDGLGIMVLRSDPAVGRFRPMYWLTRLTEITVLGDNPTAWHTLVLGIGVATALMLYATARSLDFGRALSVLLAAWVLVAPGISSVWVRLGPNETFGMLFLSLAALCAVRAGRTEDRWARVAWDVGFLLCSMATFLSKESMMLTAPALAGLRLLVGSSRSAALAVLAIGAALTLAAVGIGRAAGTQSNEADFLALPDLRTELVRFAHNLAILTFAACGWLVLLLVPRLSGFRERRCEFKRALRVVTLAGVLILPQLVLYSNVGILEGRYELPAAIGVIGLVVASLRWLQQEGATRLYRLGVALLASTLVTFGVSSWTYAAYFTADSVALHQMLQAVVLDAPRNDVIGIAGDPARQYEPILSMATYVARLGRDETHIKLLPLEPAAPPYSTGELNLVRAIQSTAVMASPTLTQLGCNHLGALVALREDASIEQQLPCLSAGFQRRAFSTRVLLWGGDAVSLRPRLPGFTDVTYVALVST